MRPNAVGIGEQSVRTLSVSNGKTKMSSINQFKDLFQGQRYRGLALGVILLAILAVTQVNQLQPQSSTCELFRGSLKSSDLERIQLALGNAGLNDFEIENGKLFVPKAHRASYLQAVSTHNAIPSRLREQVADTDSISMFMSRSQQKMVAREKKKSQVREMVMRLPYVEQVWFEIDVAESANAFEPAQQTAVISIEPADNVILDATQIGTVKRMIQGAIAGIQTEQIQVVDIQSGYAHQGPANQQSSAGIQGLPALEQQNYFENRIRRALANMDGVDVNVKVDVVKIPAPNVSQVSVPEPKPVARLQTAPLTNSYASIYQKGKGEPTVAQASFAKPQPTFVTHVAVDVAVPQKLVKDWAGESFRGSKHGGHFASSDLEAAFEQVRSEIVNRVSPLLPATTSMVHGQAPISVRLVQPQLQAPATWLDQWKPFLVKYWPSIAVLTIGVLLIGTMTRSDRRRQQMIDEAQSSSADILSINSGLEERVAAETDTATTEVDLAARREAERKLNKLIEKDPGNARKVIENWIKDAA